MQERFKQKIKTLKQEYEAGRKMMAELEAKQNGLRDTLLRISGAIQVLEELLNEEQIKESDEHLQEQMTTKPNSAQPIDVSAE